MKLTLLCAFFWLSLTGFSQDNEKSFLQKAKSDLIRDFNNGRNEFWIVFKEQADVSEAKNLKTKKEKGEYVFQKLTETARRVQAPFISLLNNKGVDFQAFWIANAISIKGDIALAKELSAYPEVKELLPNTRFRVEEPIDPSYENVARQDATSVYAIEWGLTKVNAPQVWAMGYKGQGVVVGGQDTGYEFDNLCLETQYRGYTGFNPDHNFNWHDAIHTTGSNCGANSPMPCDDNNHGTHTMGTMVGDDGAGNQIGMAPMAKWIGARNMNAGVGTPSTYNECWQWFLAPTDLNNQNPTPSKAPDVINNSWGCDAAEGCNSTNYSTMETAISNLRAAGVVVVCSAGNDGPNCNTVNGPPAHFDESFTVGSTTSSDAISSFSSRGNVNVDGSNRIKPDVCAPGSNIRSCIPGGSFASYSGTSMAGPHVVGAVALLISAKPSLAGQVDTIESILEKTAVHITSTQTCNGTAPSVYPNNTVGYGRINILAAVNYALSSTTSIDNANPVSKGITVYPTPAIDDLFAIIENAKDVVSQVEIFNPTGQLVLNESILMNYHSLDIPIHALNGGVYMYSIKTGDRTYNGKFIKK